MTLAVIMLSAFAYIQQSTDSTAVLTMVNDDFLKWAFRALIAAGGAYLVREHGRQRRQDEAILRLEHAMSLNHPSKADFDAYRFRQEQILQEVRDDVQQIDRIMRLIAAKQNIDVRV
jgi:Lhr-like helicase